MTSTEEQPIRVITTYTTGKVKIVENTQYNYINADEVEVLPGVKARLFGLVKDVVVHPDSKVFIHGNVSGQIKNLGGRIYVYNHT